MWIENEDSWLPAGAWNQCVGEPEFTAGRTSGLVSTSAAKEARQQSSGRTPTFMSAATSSTATVASSTASTRSAISQTTSTFVRWRSTPGDSARLRRSSRRKAVTAFPQSDSRIIPASDRLYRAVIERRLVLPDNPAMRRHATAAIARHGRRGWRIDKTNRADSIDSIIALCMCLEAVENQPAEVELLGWL
jgi:hypothetical protein